MFKIFKRELEKLQLEEKVAPKSVDMRKVYSPTGEVLQYAKMLSYEEIRAEMSKKKDEEDIVLEDVVCEEATIQKLRNEGYWVCIMWSRITTGRVSLHIIKKP